MLTSLTTLATPSQCEMAVGNTAIAPVANRLNESLTSFTLIPLAMTHLSLGPRRETLLSTRIFWRTQFTGL